jgi:phosphatidylglycerophosphate synthase
MRSAKNFTYKEMDAGHKEFLSMLIYRPIANFMLNRVFRHTNVTPNQITLFSLAIIIIASSFFAFSRYPLVLIGILFLHLGYALDMLDGQYARYKGLSSKFGQWLDPFIDVIKGAFLYTSLSYGTYLAENNPLVFLWGIIALTNTFLTFYILNTRGQIMKGHNFELKLKKYVYVGYEISLYWVMSIAVLFNKVHVGLIFLATAGAFSWIKPYITFMRYCKMHKEQIERN